MKLYSFIMTLLIPTLVLGDDYGREEWETNFLAAASQSGISPFSVHIEYSITDICGVVVHSFEDSSDGSIIDEELQKKIVAKFLGPYTSQQRKIEFQPIEGKPKLVMEIKSQIKWPTSDGRTVLECFFSLDGVLLYAEFVHPNLAPAPTAPRIRIKTSLSTLEPKI